MSIKKIIGAVVALIVGLFLIALVRTLMPVGGSDQATGETARLIEVDPQAAAQNLSRALQFKTVTTQNSEDTDWPIFLEFQAWLQETYPNFHGAVSTQMMETYTPFHTWQGSDASLAPIVFLAHQDVVPATEEPDSGWQHPPFDGVIEQGVIFGRGAVDDKGSLIGILEAADRLAASGFTPERTLIFVFGHNEEVSGSGARAAAELLRSQGVSPLAVFDEGGAVVNGLGGGTKPVAIVAAAEKGYLTLTLTSEARGGHSSTPPNYTAIGALSKAIARIEANPFKQDFDPISTGLLKTLSTEQSFFQKMAMRNLWLFGPLVKKSMKDDDAMRAILGTTIAPTIIDAGFKENALPREAKAYINFRLHPRDSIEDVIAHVTRAVDDPAIKIEKAKGFMGEASPVSPIGTGSYAMIENIVRQVFPDAVTAPNMLTAATDSRHFVIVTDNVYRFAPIQMELADMGRIHGINEQTSVASHAKAIQAYYLMLTEASKPEGG
ncbi:MAG: M20 family peptidase [Maricaulaceae bacterium]